MYLSQKLKVMAVDDAAGSVNSVLEQLKRYGVPIAGVANLGNNEPPLDNAVDFDIALATADSLLQTERLIELICKIHHKPLVLLANTGDVADPARTEGLIAMLYNTAETTSDSLPRKKVDTDEDDLYFFVRLGETYKRVAWKNVVYLRSEQHYTCLYNAADKQEYFIRASLNKTLHSIMPVVYREHFAQINRAEAVQLSYITEFCGNELHTAYGKMMLSEGYYRQLRSKIMCIA